MMPRDTPAYSAPTARALALYREEQINNLGQKELILMLYDGALRFCASARMAIEAGDVATSYDQLVRARNVVTELFAILNPDVDVEAVQNLRRLYDFCIYGITEVNFTKDLALLDGVTNVLQTLRTTWAEIDFDGAVADVLAEHDLAPPPAQRPGPPPVPAPEPEASVADTVGPAPPGLTLTA